MLRIVNRAVCINYSSFCFHTTAFSFRGDKELKFKIQISPNDVKYKVKSMLPHIVNGKVVSVRFWSRKNTTEEEVKDKMKMIMGVVKEVASENEVEVQLKENNNILYVSGHAKPEVSDS